ncbi:hypothetical protein GJ496_004736 [Pomphorhynchus laevis]|nr:hypothetical protein GJ496_004736 [Pomphorhynchus laevis]
MQQFDDNESDDTQEDEDIFPEYSRITYCDVAGRTVAFSYFNKLISVPEIVQIRLFTSNNVRLATLGCRQYHLDTNQDLYHNHIIFIHQESLNSSANIFNLSTRVGHNSVYLCINDDGSMVASIAEGAESNNLAIGHASRGITRTIDITRNSAISRIYKPTRDFGAFTWSSDNRFIIVVVRPGKDPNKGLTAPLTFDAIFQDKRYVDRTGPGEGFSSVDDFSIAVLNVTSAFINFLPTPTGYFPSQFTYSDVNKSFYFVGIRNDPSYSVGLLFCSNRPTKIFMATCVNPHNPDGRWTLVPLLDGELTRSCYHSPRISPDGQTLVYTRNLPNGPHDHCRAICKIRIPFTNGIEKVLVDIVEFQHNQLPSTYIGLYEDLPETCWLSDSKFIVFSASKGYFMHMYRLTVAENLEEYGHLVHIRAPTISIGGCWTVRSVYQNKIIVTFSSSEKSTEILIGTIVDPFPVNNQINLHWLIILHGSPGFSHITIQRKLLSNPVPRPSNPGVHPDDDINEGIFEESFLITSQGLSELAPTIISVHGGPNASFHDEFSHNTAIMQTFVACGFNVLELNYVGSLGYGQRSLRFLTGYVLDRDVESCLRLIRDACSKHRLNRQRLFFLGESHSGGIGIHLMARYPYMFAAAALYNPVCDYVTLLIGSDIPDYTFHQVLRRTFYMDFDFNNSVVEALIAKSPLALAAKLNTPILLFLGSDDTRVPHRAAIRLKQILESKGIPCKARIYPDGHTFKSKAYLQDSFVHMYDWFLHFLPKPNQEVDDIDYDSFDNEMNGHATEYDSDISLD